MQLRVSTCQLQCNAPVERCSCSSAHSRADGTKGTVGHGAATTSAIATRGSKALAQHFSASPALHLRSLSSAFEGCSRKQTGCFRVVCFKKREGRRCRSAGQHARVSVGWEESDPFVSGGVSTTVHLAAVLSQATRLRPDEAACHRPAISFRPPHAHARLHHSPLHSSLSLRAHAT